MYNNRYHRPMSAFHVIIVCFLETLFCVKCVQLHSRRVMEFS
jgi:hypothetical protein